MITALTRRHAIAAIAAAAILPGWTGPALAADWAMGGYDPVALRREGRAVAGAAAIYTYWRGKMWHFASEDNRAVFEANPRAYIPGFDGLCPIALTEGRPSLGDPLHFVIIGDRIYLTRSETARRRLLADPRAVLMAAKANWLQLDR